MPNDNLPEAVIEARDRWLASEQRLDRCPPSEEREQLYIKTLSARLGYLAACGRFGVLADDQSGMLAKDSSAAWFGDSRIGAGWR